MFDLEQIGKAFLVLFAVIDVVGGIPLILQVRQKAGRIYPARATLVSLAIMVTFLYLGETILGVVGVDVRSFAVAGSLVLFFLALEMVLGVRLFKEDTSAPGLPSDDPKVYSIVPLAFPVIAAQIYKFVAPGLYKNERSAFLPFLVASPILFLIGAALVYAFFMPMVMWFFLSMEQSGDGSQVAIQLLPKVSEYLGLIMTLIFAFGLVFQLPVVTTLQVRVGMLSSQGLADKRKYAIVIAFIVAAVLTPPDPVSQLGLAIPTILLYEVSVWLARRIERSRESRQDGAAEEAPPAESGSAS